MRFSLRVLSGPGVLHDVASEGASQRAAVGADFFNGHDDEGVFGQSLRDGWEFALFDLFGENGSFVKGAVLEYGGIDFEGGTGLRCLLLRAGCRLGGACSDQGRERGIRGRKRIGKSKVNDGSC